MSLPVPVPLHPGIACTLALPNDLLSSCPYQHQCRPGLHQHRHQRRPGLHQHRYQRCLGLQQHELVLEGQRRLALQQHELMLKGQRRLGLQQHQQDQGRKSIINKLQAVSGGAFSPTKPRLKLQMAMDGSEASKVCAHMGSMGFYPQMSQRAAQVWAQAHDLKGNYDVQLAWLVLYPSFPGSAKTVLLPARTHPPVLICKHAMHG